MYRMDKIIRIINNKLNNKQTKYKAYSHFHAFKVYSKTIYTKNIK